MTEWVIETFMVMVGPCLTFWLVRWGLERVREMGDPYS